MKRFSEKFKQSLGIGAGSKTKEWKPTSNARNEACLKEVRKFAQHLKAFQKECKDLQAATDSGLSTFKSILTSALPRAHDETPAGILPIEQVEHPIGLTVNADILQVANHEAQQRLQQDVISPMDQWLSEYRNTKELHKKCETIRLDLDDKRRTTLALQEKYQKFKDHNHKDTEATMHKVQHEEDKLNRLAQRYAEKEAEVFNAYLRLIRDSAVLREFIASALGILMRCFTTAYGAFEVAAPPPLPALPLPAPVPQIEYKPADINASQRYSITATAVAAASMTAPAPLARGISTRQASISAAGGPSDAPSLGSSATFAAYGSTGGAAAAAAAAGAAIATTPGAYPPAPTFSAVGSATMPAGTTYNPNATMAKGPASPNSEAAKAATIASTPAPIAPIPENAPVLEHAPTPSPAPAAPVAAPVNPTTPTPNTPPQTLPQPSSAWAPAASHPHPPSENGSIDSDSNPFITNPVPSVEPPPPPPEKEPTGDPANPFKISDDGRQAIPA